MAAPEKFINTENKLFYNKSIISVKRILSEGEEQRIASSRWGHILPRKINSLHSLNYNDLIKSI